MNNKKAKGLRREAKRALIYKIYTTLSDKDRDAFVAMPEEKQLEIATSGSHNIRTVYKRLKRYYLGKYLGPYTENFNG